jgi:hypothetical protein
VFTGVFADVRLLVSYADALLSLNETSITSLPPPPPPPGVELTRSLARLGIDIYTVNSTTASAAQQLCYVLEEQNPLISSCEVDIAVKLDQLSAQPNDKLYANQYAFAVDNTVAAWQAGQFGSSNIKVCVIDTVSSPVSCADLQPVCLCF